MRFSFWPRAALATLLAAALPHCAPAADEDELAAALRQLDGTVAPAGSDTAKRLKSMLSEDVRARLRAASERETKAWRAIETKGDWERYRDARLTALRTALGDWPAPPKEVKVQVTRTTDGDGFRVENVVFESRPGLVVTANVYSPKPLPKSTPGVVICPSHHNPKTQGELQDMGMSWARQGAVVIVPDNLGHGERRQHPFQEAADFAGPFRVGRQDYYFRYNVGMQLHLVGESLAGWIAWDLLRCVDVLLARPHMDGERILLLGSVAGGGDPAAIAGALDPRIKAVGAFNFGGPQPETTFPLPENAEDAFNYTGSGSWESTRNLRLSARDGFLPWVIVGAAAPRRTIYGHEFSWDQEHDPVWARLQKIYGFYEAPDRVAATHGKGKVTGLAGPDNTHCNNIGPVHRAGMYPALNRWFDVTWSSEKEYHQPLPGKDLLCLAPDAAKDVKVRPLCELAAELARQRGQAAREKRAEQAYEERRKSLHAAWERLLGPIEPGDPKVAERKAAVERDAVKVERILLEVEPRIVVPLLVLSPARAVEGRRPVVVGFGQSGKQAFLQQRSDALAELLRGGALVVLPDLRGTGETKLGDSRDRGSSSTSWSASELMLGQTAVGARLRDLRAVLKYLRSREDVDAGRIALWGESFAAPNGPAVELRVPLDAEKMPAQAEPLGALLALLGGLFEADVRAVSAAGGLTGYASVLQSPFCYVPHDVIVPGVLATGDLVDVAEALAPRPLRLVGFVDGQNRPVSADTLTKEYFAVKRVYDNVKKSDRLTFDGGAAPWLLTQLKEK